MSERIKVTCPVCKRKRMVSEETKRLERFTGLCGSCARKRSHFTNPRPKSLPQVEVTCPDCKQTRTLNRASTQVQDFTGLCIKCARKRAYAKPVEPEPTQTKKKQWCLKCEIEIPVNPRLRLCETCRATNERGGDPLEHFSGGNARSSGAGHDRPSFWPIQL